MSLIFDCFPSRQRAEAFAAAVTERFGQAGTVFDDVDKANEHDPFPFNLTPPIVHIERKARTAHREGDIIALVESYQGEFAGT